MQVSANKFRLSCIEAAVLAKKENEERYLHQFDTPDIKQLFLPSTANLDSHLG